jgi:drug/metabolite transporter (DMT)-like permease
MLNVSIFLFLCLIWGSTWLAIKIGLEGAPAFLSAGIRFTVASAVLILLTTFARRWKQPLWKSWRHVLLAALLTFPITYGLVYWGTQYIESGLAGVLFATMPFFVAAMAHLMIPDEKLTLLKTSGMLIGFLGICLIFKDSFSAKRALGMWGMGAIIAASFFSAMGMIVIKKHLHHLDPLPLTASQAVIGAVSLTLLGLIIEPMSDFRIETKTVGSILYLGIVGTAVAFTLYFYLLRRMEATRLSLIAFITPVMALFLGVIYRQESLNSLCILGSFFVVLGVFVVVMGGNLQKARQSPAAAE